MMTKINLESLQSILTESEMEIAIHCFNQKNGVLTLKASKPILKKNLCPSQERTIRQAMYLWRNLVFTLSTKSQHQCLPVMAEFDLPLYPPCKNKSYFSMSDDEKARVAQRNKEMKEKLHKIEDKIIKQVPKSEWHGVTRWGRALGYI